MKNKYSETLNNKFNKYPDLKENPIFILGKLKRIRKNFKSNDKKRRNFL